jgi:hypothetical protein
LDVVTNRECNVPYDYLRGTDYNLVLGDDILFQVKAMNVIDWGPLSVTNTVIQVVKTEPLSPLTMVTEGELTDDS